MLNDTSVHNKDLRSFTTHVPIISQHPYTLKQNAVMLAFEIGKVTILPWTNSFTMISTATEMKIFFTISMLAQMLN